MTSLWDETLKKRDMRIMQSKKNEVIENGFKWNFNFSAIFKSVFLYKRPIQYEMKLDGKKISN